MRRFAVGCPCCDSTSSPVQWYSVRKLDSDLNEIWKARFGGSISELDRVRTPNGITGDGTSVWVVGQDIAGVATFTAKKFDATTGDVDSTAIDVGETMLDAWTDGTFFYTTESSTHVRKWSFDGTQQWDSTLQYDKVNEGVRIVADDAGQVYALATESNLSGFQAHVESFDSTGGWLWAYRPISWPGALAYPVGGLVVADDGTGCVAAVQSGCPICKTIVQLDSTGGDVWSLDQTSVAGGDAVFGRSIVFDDGTSGDFYAGATKYDSTGGVVWDHGIYSGEHNTVDNALDSTGNLICVGFADSTGHNVWKLDADGTLLATFQHGDGDDAVNAVFVDASDNVFIVGDAVQE